MRSRPFTDESVSDVTRRRLDALIAELAEARGEEPPSAAPDGEESRSAGQVTSRGPVAGTSPSSARPSSGRHAQRPLSAGRRLTGWVGDRLPASVQGRAHLGSAQFGVVALVVAVGLVVGAWWLVRSGGTSGGAGEAAPPRPTVVAPASPVGEQPGESSGAASGTPSAGVSGASGTAEDEVVGQIVVDVVGKVRRPGIAVLPAGSRVIDAVRAAGGMRAGVDPVTVNMARPLSDGEQLVIGRAAVPGAPVGPAPATSSVPGAPGALVNLNTADQAALETLPGVGPVTAAAILEWRAQHGGFTAVEELLEVSGIGDATLAEIAPHVTL